MTIYDRKIDARPFGITKGILRCLSFVQSLFKDQTAPIWRIGNRRVKSFFSLFRQSNCNYFRSIFWTLRYTETFCSHRGRVFWTNFLFGIWLVLRLKNPSHISDIHIFKPETFTYVYENWDTPIRATQLLIGSKLRDHKHYLAVTITAMTIVYPFDSLRRRMMIGHDFGPNHGSAINLTKQILKSEGVQGFYKGAAINVLRGTGGIKMFTNESLSKIYNLTPSSPMG